MGIAYCLAPEARCPSLLVLPAFTPRHRTIKVDLGYSGENVKLWV